MSREFDQASALEQLERERSIEAARASKKKIEATGYCLSCEEELPEGERWCDKHCRDDWQRDNPGA